MKEKEKYLKDIQNTRVVVEVGQKCPVCGEVLGLDVALTRERQIVHEACTTESLVELNDLFSYVCCRDRRGLRRMIG